MEDGCVQMDIPYLLPIGMREAEDMAHLVSDRRLEVVTVHTRLEEVRIKGGDEDEDEDADE